MHAWEIRAKRQVSERVCVVVENPADFVHIGDAVVVLGTEGEARKGTKFGDADRVEVPPSRNRNRKKRGRHDVA